ncbi:hypothetical protein Raf01_12490 [Rugosimonospora africana]|uniref:Uncharacterized protein n=1 Tax=Rugosimonospora africana TaxID=556532 RepID=A0A8J3VNP4_9ACTN|nr:hypothetical protein Raf01_12490 [Rugosimonospora africana]
MTRRASPAADMPASLINAAKALFGWPITPPEWSRWRIPYRSAAHAVIRLGRSHTFHMGVHMVCPADATEFDQTPDRVGVGAEARLRSLRRIPNQKERANERLASTQARRRRPSAVVLTGSLSGGPPWQKP